MKLLKHNWQWKLTSLIIGILMWSYITAGVNPTQSATLSDIPIRIINLMVLVLSVLYTLFRVKGGHTHIDHNIEVTAIGSSNDK